jgi:SanA protein
MKNLKFVFAFSFWLFLLVAIVMVIHFRDYQNAYEALKNLDPVKPLSKLEALREYFMHSDQWSKIYATIIVSVLMVLFVINDHWIKSSFKRMLQTLQNYSNSTAVLGWVVHKAAAAIMVAAQFIVIINIIIIMTTELYIFSLSNVIEEKKIALLLGTNKTLSDNKTPNLYYIYRINAAEELYKSGKTETIIISGDKNDNGYNEPMDMMRDLLKRGIPQHAIKLDYSGFRTLDSVYRLKYESDVNDVVIITQKFHLQRALFLAQFYNIKAVGFQAQGTMTRSMVKRELLAKPKVILDIFVFNMKPKNGKVITRQQVQFAKPQHKTLVVSVVILLLITAWFFIESLKFQKYR